jgi:hypothetical protein
MCNILGARLDPPRSEATREAKLLQYCNLASRVASDLGGSRRAPKMLHITTLGALASIEQIDRVGVIQELRIESPEGCDV